MSRPLDDHQWQIAAQAERAHPRWAVLWGYHSRLYWAFPRFDTPPGTIITAPDQAALTERMPVTTARTSADPATQGRDNNDRQDSGPNLSRWTGSNRQPDARQITGRGYRQHLADSKAAPPP